MNKNDQKINIEIKEKGKEESELDCALRFWNLYLKNNDSIIADLFFGLFKLDAICSECGFDNITFELFNTLTLDIPNSYFLKKQFSTHTDTTFFYIPKYGIGKNLRITIHIPKKIQYKDIVKKINKIENFPHKLNKLIYFKVKDSKFERFFNLNEKKNDGREYIFLFDDLRTSEDSKILPLYMFKNDHISAFPRLLFINDNMTFRELKKQIYYYARSFIEIPLDSEGKNLENKIKFIKEDCTPEKEESLLNEIFELINKEYHKIFSGDDKKEKLKDFFNDFPFEITITKKFNEERHIMLFNGKNNLETLKNFKIANDDDPIFSLIENKEYCLNLIIKESSSFTIKKFNLNSCESLEDKDVGKEEKIEEINLDNLLEYFYSKEYQKIENKFKCGNCSKFTTAKKKYSLYYVPKLLVICIKRFSDNSKNNILINFPIENFDIGKYIYGPDKK